MTADFCVEALEMAMRHYGTPEIVKTDQGSQFTSDEFISTVLDSGAQLNMDGKGAWRDNIFIERFWRNVKYEEVYLRAYETVSDASTSRALHDVLQQPPSAQFARRADAGCRVLQPNIDGSMIIGSSGDRARSLLRAALDPSMTFNPQPIHLRIEDCCSRKPDHLCR